MVAAPAPALAPGGTASLTLRVLGSRQPEAVEVITTHPGTATLDGRVSPVAGSRRRFMPTLTRVWKKSTVATPTAM